MHCIIGYKSSYLNGTALVVQTFEMSSSAWNSELQQEGVEHQLPNNYLVSLTPRVFNYGVEVELPRVSRHIVANGRYADNVG